MSIDLASANLNALGCSGDGSLAGNGTKSVVSASCFGETATYGLTGSTAAKVSDKTQLNGIDVSVFNDNTRASLLAFCTDVSSGYL